MPVPQTSPSPWAKWRSPTETSAPSTCTGSVIREPATSWRMSRLPPISRGGIVRRPALASGWDCRFRQLVGNGGAGIRERLLALRDRLHQLLRGGDAYDSGEGVSCNGHARQLRRSRVAAGDVPFHEKGVGEQICEVAEAGDDGGHAEVGGLVGDELDIDDVARHGTLDVHGSRQRMPEPEVEREHVRQRAVRCELTVEPVARLERDLVARPDTGHGLEARVPAVVRPCGGDPHSSSATRLAASVAAAISSAVQVRGRPSWCKETTAFKRSPSRMGVTIWAARPP